MALHEARTPVAARILAAQFWTGAVLAIVFGLPFLVANLLLIAGAFVEPVFLGGDLVAGAGLVALPLSIIVIACAVFYFFLGRTLLHPRTWTRPVSQAILWMSLSAGILVPVWSPILSPLLNESATSLLGFGFQVGGAIHQGAFSVLPFFWPRNFFDVFTIPLWFLDDPYEVRFTVLSITSFAGLVVNAYCLIRLYQRDMKDFFGSAGRRA